MFVALNKCFYDSVYGSVMEGTSWHHVRDKIARVLDILVAGTLLSIGLTTLISPHALLATHTTASLFLLKTGNWTIGAGTIYSAIVILQTIAKIRKDNPFKNTTEDLDE